MLSLSIEGTAHDCGFIAPDDLPSNTLTPLACGDGIDAYIEQRRTCTITRNGDSASSSCTPTPDDYQVSLEIAGNPKTIETTLTRDDQVVLSDSREVHYERDYPNGSDCDEGCSQGGYQLTLED